MNKKSLKILTVCEHGNVRSVAMAYLIKVVYHHRHEVIPIGIKDISDNTRQMLFDWADKIIFMDQTLVPIPLHENDKLYLVDVGKDVWNNPQAQELLHKCLKGLQNLDL